MPTIVKEVSDLKQIAEGNNIITVVLPGKREYQVSGIVPYPNDHLIVGKKYQISDSAHQHDLVVFLKSPPCNRMMRAIFESEQ